MSFPGASGQASHRPEVAGVSVEADHLGLRHDGDQRQPFERVGGIVPRIVSEIADPFQCRVVLPEIGSWVELVA